MQSTSQSGMASSLTDDREFAGNAMPSSPEWLSAFMDGEQELDDDGLPAALTSAEGRARWDAYHLIGDVLRSPALAQPVSSSFHARMVAALDGEAPIIAAPRRSRQRRFMNRYGFPGLAAAAAVASVTWMAQPYFGAQPTNGVEFAAQVDTMAAGGITTVSAPAPRPVDRVDPALEQSLGEYLDAHRQVSGRSAIRQVSTRFYDSQEGQH